MRSAWGVAAALILSAVLRVAAATPTAPPHVVLVVWDGMRPDFVNEQNCPTLAKLAHDGVWFRNHHSIYPTATDVNAAALATGCYPNKSGILANGVYRPEVDKTKPVDNGDPEVIKRVDELSGGKFLEVPTFVETLRAARKTVALAGTKSAAIFFDRKNDWLTESAENKPATILAVAPATTAVRELITKQLGPIHTETAATSAERNRYTTRALTEVLWRDGVPDFSLLWLSEPDLAQHDHAPGSPEALAAIHQSDDNLAILLKALDQKHVRDATDVIVVSDHGFSTIGKSFDLIAMLKAAGFRADKSWPNGLSRGDIMVAGNGGTCLFYVGEHDAPTAERLVAFMQEHCDGVALTPAGAEGTFEEAALRLDHAASADVVFAFAGAELKNEFGARGMIGADWNRHEGEGTHATLNRCDIQNVGIAAGPSFKANSRYEIPSGNIDVAPTVLDLLHVSGAHFDGRSLVAPLPRSRVFGDHYKGEDQHAGRDLPDGRWEQHLGTSEVGNTVYFDEANGYRKPRE